MNSVPVELVACPGCCWFSADTAYRYGLRIAEADAIFAAGDLFGTSMTPDFAREQLNNFIDRMQGSEIKLILLGGKHDSPATLGEGHQLLSGLQVGTGREDARYRQGLGLRVAGRSGRSGRLEDTSLAQGQDAHQRWALHRVERSGGRLVHHRDRQASAARRIVSMQPAAALGEESGWAAELIPMDFYLDR